MRRILIAATALAVGTGLAACGSSSTNTVPPASSGALASCSQTGMQKYLYSKGALTVATDNPVYTPWFVNNKPTNGQGYESAVAYAIAHQLGFKPSQVKWVTEPFTSSYAPGPKKFDFDINEVSYTPQRAQAVTFSNSYYPVQQAILALKGSPIVTHHSPAEATSSTMMSRWICWGMAGSGQVGRRWPGASWNARPEVVSLAATTTQSWLW